MKKFRQVAVCLLVVFSFLWGSQVGCTVSGPPQQPPPAKEAFTRVDTSPPPLLIPSDTDTEVGKEIVSELKKRHYSKLVLDDGFSKRLFERYLEDLDGQRLYFLGGDIEGFDPYRLTLDDALLKGDLRPAFDIFNRYTQRAHERALYANRLIAGGFDEMDFEKDESLQIDRENAPWPADEAEMDELWRKRIKNEVLSLKMAGKPLAEIDKLLVERYKSQLHRIEQMSQEDAFLTFVNAVTRTHDPHSQYFSPRMVENFNIHMSLSLEGIGAVLQRENDYTKVVRLVPGGPAEKAGQLKPDDRIVGVGQGEDAPLVDVIGWRLDDVVDLIRGPKDTVVRLEVIPADAVDDSQRTILRITRNEVKLEDQAATKKVMKIESAGVTYRIGVIDIPTFYIDFEAYRSGESDYRSTTRDVHRILVELKSEGVDGVVVDLRNNGGGALQEAAALTGLFIKSGPTAQVRGPWGRISEVPDNDPHIVYDGPLLVLVNRMSASASEIFAGAIQDYRRGIVAGSRTYGKGTVQALTNLSQGQLKYTMAKFYRISGEGMQRQGVEPDIHYPEMYDIEKVGESAIPDALPWDLIPPSKYTVYPDNSDILKRLTAIHEKRSRTSPDFRYLVERVEEQKLLQKKTNISLRESVREKERKETEQRRLDMENQRRLAKGETPLASVEDLKKLDEEIEEGGDPKKPDEPDPLLEESAELLCDYISLSNRALAKRP